MAVSAFSREAQRNGCMWVRAPELVELAAPPGFVERVKVERVLQPVKPVRESRASRNRSTRSIAVRTVSDRGWGSVKRFDRARTST